MRMPTSCQQCVTIPNLVTLIRPACTLPFVVLCGQVQPPPVTWGHAEIALLFTIIAGSDILDGWLARRLGQASTMGRALDHLCDILFILTALGFFVSRGLAPWWLPGAIAWAFTLYVVDSCWRTAGQAQPVLLASRVGHLGGILYYATVGMVTGHVCLGDNLLPFGLMYDWFIGIALLALLSGFERLTLLACFSGPRSPAKPTVENIHRSIHSEP